MKKPEPIRRVPELPSRQAPQARARVVARKPLAAFDSAPDPIRDMPAGTPPDVSTKAELTDIQRGFRERMAAEEKRFRMATDGSYYATVCFESGEQCDAFFAYFGIDNGKGSLFVDGRIMADKLGIPMPPADLRATENRINPKLAALARKIGEK
jgi:hypothetical protein